MADGRRNAQFYYTVDGQAHSFPLTVEIVSQPQTLEVNMAQSRMFKQVYPRAHMPGDISVTGRALSQGELQSLGLFVRRHHKALISTPASVMFTRTNSSPGYQRLLRLVIPIEGIVVRGFVKRFDIKKRGVFEPAPQYTFDFTVVFDPHASQIEASRIVKQYYSKSDNIIPGHFFVSEEGNAETPGSLIGGIVGDIGDQYLP